MAEKNSLETYIITYLGAYEALRRAGDQTAAMSQNMALASDVRARVGALSLDFGVQLLQLKVAHEAFMSTFTVVKPPSQAIIDQAVANTKALAAEVADNLLAQGKLEAVFGFIGALNELATKPEGAAVQAGSAEMAVLTALRMEGSTSGWLQGMRAAGK
nr:hypothetical protein [uncultured Albidiferax sp.]